VYGVLMIVSVNNRVENSKKGGSFTQNAEKSLKYDKDTLLKNDMATGARISYDKFTNAMTLYPAKGLTGNKNSNFYEFLTMGTVPYLAGSLMLMSVFNSANKYLDSFSKSKASIVGKKMALGVLFYGFAKELSKSLITKPVKFATGVDVDTPYARVIYELPEDKNDTDITSIEYHKVFESTEFPRWDLLYGDATKGEKINGYYDKVAKKLGLGENLKDSDQEVKPRIKEIVTKANAVQNLVPYLWAGLGVGLAVQEPWENFFKVATMKFWKVPEFKKSLKTFGKSFVESAKELYTGGKGAKGLNKWAGKTFIGIAVLATILGDLKIISSSKKPSQLKSTDVVDKTRKYVVS